MYDQRNTPDSQFTANRGAVSVAIETCQEGISKGARILTVNDSEGGLQYEVQLSHGMNIGPDSSYKGKSIFWDAPNPLRVYSEAEMDTELQRAKTHKKDGAVIGGLGGWLDTFNAGLILCGLDCCGSPGEDPVTGESLTLHSRIGLLPAENVTVRYQQIGEARYQVVIEGDVTQYMGDVPSYKLHRRITTDVGGNEIGVEDTVENLTDVTLPLDALYHIQLGGAALEKGSVFSTPAIAHLDRDDDAKAGRANINSMPGIGDTKYEREKLWFHIFPEIEKVTSLLRNPDASFGVYTRHDQRELPQFSQWQQNGGWQFKIEDPENYKEVWYVNAPEPGFTRCPNRSVEREEGRLQYLGPRERRTVHVVVGALDQQSQIMSIEDIIKQHKSVPRDEFIAA